jgi:hypothetical protein
MIIDSQNLIASHNDGLLISEATKKNDFNSRAVNMDHENLHAFSCVCASFFVYPLGNAKKMKKGKTRKN